MRSITTLFLLFMVGCVNPHILNAPDITEPDVVVSHNVKIVFDDTEYSRWTKNRIAEQIDRFPQIHNWLKQVTVTPNLKAGVTGWCDWDLQEFHLRNVGWPRMRSTLWHEIAHALQKTNLTEAQLKKWITLAVDDLDRIGLEDFTRTKWKHLKSADGFPTTYATKDVWEYMAEHFEAFMDHRQRHKDMYPEENALIIECGWEPKK